MFQNRDENDNKSDIYNKKKLPYLIGQSRRRGDTLQINFSSESPNLK